MEPTAAHNSELSADTSRPPLAGLGAQQLREWALGAGAPAYRGAQIADWVYRRSARDIGQMSDLPIHLRDLLSQQFLHPACRLTSSSVSGDGSAKLLWQLADSLSVETVLLPYERRTSVCVSTQVGCAMDCKFCATGIGGLARNLLAGEIVDQVLGAQAECKASVTHVVYMGMGEPLQNYVNTTSSIRLINQELGISVRRITVSTVGIAPAIRRLADEKLGVTLAVSIHAPSDDLRAQFMPVASMHSLPSLIDACRYFAETTGRRVTFEYLLMDGLNDHPAQARELARVIRPVLANVNLIPYNYVEGRGEFRRSSQQAIARFRRALETQGVTVTQRLRRGNPIDAACGQLRNTAEGSKVRPQ